MSLFDFSAHQPMWIPMLAGATARTTAVTIVSPLELIRTKMQSKKLTFAGNIIIYLCDFELNIVLVSGLYKYIHDGNTLYAYYNI